MRKVPEGRLITINDIRRALARNHHATIGCPITTGIFAHIAAEAAAEAAAEGKKNTTPYWRTLKTGGEINEKYPGGIESQKKRLEDEGHQIIQKGKKYIVADLKISGRIVDNRPEFFNKHYSKLFIACRTGNGDN